MRRVLETPSTKPEPTSPSDRQAEKIPTCLRQGTLPRSGKAPEPTSRNQINKYIYREREREREREKERERSDTTTVTMQRTNVSDLKGAVDSFQLD